MTKTARKSDQAQEPTVATETQAPPEMVRIRKNAIRQLPKDAVRPDGTHFTGWSVVAHAEDTIDDALHPLYLWARKDEIRRLDTITIKHPFMEWTVVLEVSQVSERPRGIFSEIRHIFQYTDPNRQRVMPDLSGARIEYRGSDAQWSVIDEHHVLIEKLPTRAAAEAWLQQMTGG